MISKVFTGKTFKGTCEYVCMDQRRAKVLETEGVRSYDHKLMAADFEMQRALRPSLIKAVVHGIISFNPVEKIEDSIMTEIAKEYLQKTGIINTQFAIAKHIDKKHSHLHIIANLVNNNGEAIRDSWIGLRGKKALQELTKKYGLMEEISKDLSRTNFEALNKKDRARYNIYEAILVKLPYSKNLDDLKQKLQNENIGTLYKYAEQTNELIGISFSIGNYKFKGSKVDRKFSVKNLGKLFEQMRFANELSGNHISSKILLKNTQHEISESINNNKLQLLMKREKNNQSLLLEKTPKRKSGGMHL